MDQTLRKPMPKEVYDFCYAMQFSIQDSIRQRAKQLLEEYFPSTPISEQDKEAEKAWILWQVNNRSKPTTHYDASLTYEKGQKFILHGVQSLELQVTGIITT